REPGDVGGTDDGGPAHAAPPEASGASTLRARGPAMCSATRRGASPRRTSRPASMFRATPDWGGVALEHADEVALAGALRGHQGAAVGVVDIADDPLLSTDGDERSRGG